MASALYSSSVRSLSHQTEKQQAPAKKLTLSYGQRLYPDSDPSLLRAVPLTKAHFLDAYSKAKWNLSKVPRPACFDESDMITPPDHYNEASRYKAVKKFMYCEQWKDTHVFHKIISRAMKTFHVKGVSISLVDSKRQVIKYESALNATEIPRKLSIDAHAILSSGSFVLPDASQDWRTSKSPLVTSPPSIRFYAAAPLVTKFGAVIGAFSIFDASTREVFDKKQIEELKGFADEVMLLLNAPLKPISSQLNNSMSLISIIGRPTSHGNHFLPAAMYEKDGSGSQYSQNHNFRYNGHEFTTQWRNILVNDEVVKLVSKHRDVKSASSQLCEVISKELNYNLVCVVEIRVSQKYQVLSEYLPAVNTINAESFKFANKLIGTEKEQVMSRVLGSHGYVIDPNYDIDPRFFFESLSSEFGVLYETAGKSNVKFRTGVCMPFYRISSKIVRKKKILKADKASVKGKPVDVYLKSGGYLICGFNEEERTIGDDEITFIYGAACTLRRLFISG